jgi:hypothetical protein
MPESTVSWRGSCSIASRQSYSFASRAIRNWEEPVPVDPLGVGGALQQYLLPESRSYAPG